MRRSTPSVRNNVSSMRRAPSPRRSRANFSRPASRATMASTSSSRAIGSAKALLGDIRRDRQPRVERLVLVAQRAVELAQQVVTETRGQRRARQIDNVADAFQADARQRCHRAGIEPQRGERQRRKQRALLAAGVTSRLAMMRGGVSRADGAGDGDAISKAGRLQAAAEIGDQRVLAAVEMRAAADVEQQAVGRIAGHQRRVAQAPVGDRFEQRGIGLGVFRDRLDAPDAWRAPAPAPCRAKARAVPPRHRRR